MVESFIGDESPKLESLKKITNKKQHKKHW